MDVNNRDNPGMVCWYMPSANESKYYGKIREVIISSFNDVCRGTGNTVKEFFVGYSDQEIRKMVFIKHVGGDGKSAWTNPEKLYPIGSNKKALMVLYGHKKDTV